MRELACVQPGGDAVDFIEPGEGAGEEPRLSLDCACLGVGADFHFPRQPQVAPGNHDQGDPEADPDQKRGMALNGRGVANRPAHAPDRRADDGDECEPVADPLRQHAARLGEMREFMRGDRGQFIVAEGAEHLGGKRDVPRDGIRQGDGRGEADLEDRGRALIEPRGGLAHDSRYPFRRGHKDGNEPPQKLGPGPEREDREQNAQDRKPQNGRLQGHQGPVDRQDRGDDHREREGSSHDPLPPERGHRAERGRDPALEDRAGDERPAGGDPGVTQGRE